MDESVEKGLKLLSVNGIDGFILKSREIGRILVKGYDTGLPHDDVERALRKHYIACGEITDVYVPMDYRCENTLRKSSFVYFLGEGAVDKALKLNGSDVGLGGWTVSAKACPFQPRPYDLVMLRVEGYDTWLSENDIKIALIDFLYSCGEVKYVVVSESSAIVCLFGDNAALKAPELSGSVMGGRRVVVRRISELGKSTAHRRPSPGRRYVYGGDISKKSMTTAE